MSANNTARRRPDERTLWRGAMYEALGLAFSYPGAGTVGDLRESLSLICGQRLTAKWDQSAMLRSLQAAAAAPPAQLAAAYNSLFAGDVLCSPCESEYGFEAFAKTKQLADIAGFYRAFGLKVSAKEAGPVDFIATELDFLSHLVLKEAYAAVNGWEERRTITKEAQRVFIEDHLGRWAPLFCRALADNVDADSFYGAAGSLCDAFIASEIQASGASPRQAPGRFADPGADEPFQCIFAAPAAGDEEEQL